MMISDSNEFGELGWGWKSIGRGLKSVGRAGLKVAAMPAKVALRVASATAGNLCKGSTPTGSDRDSTTARTFCRAMKTKDLITTRRLLPEATALAARKAKLEKTAAAVQAAYGMNGFGDSFGQGNNLDTNLLAALHGADPDSLAFALAGVDPAEIGGSFTATDLYALGPLLIAVGAGFWMLSRG